MARKKVPPAPAPKKKRGRPVAAEKRERVLILLPTDLRTWMNVKAARERQERSRIVERALLLLKKQEPD